MWSPQRYLAKGRTLGRTPSVLAAAVAQIRRAKSQKPPLPAILSLGHLAKKAGVEYSALRNYSARSASEPYLRFTIRKRSGGRRYISVPDRNLKRVQSWIARQLLRQIPVHPASSAFGPDDSTVKCAAQHCGARWLVKLDIADFFGSISEIQVYRVFRSLKYSPLVSLELARICTDRVPQSEKYRMSAWQSKGKNYKVGAYQQHVLGRLPQGAPTSPALSNLAMRQLDTEIFRIASEYGLTYTRYSDDMTFSTTEDFSRVLGVEVISKVARALKRNGLFLNKKKSTIVPPGARKVVLGLLVDREAPALPREFKDRLRQHIYHLKKHGIDNHVARREFDSIGGAYRYLLGTINYAHMVDAEFAANIRAEFDNLPWPGT
jgi:RNA-directed DNA polymerase